MKVTNSCARWIGCLALLAGCAVEAPASNAPEANAADSTEASLVGSYALRNGGKLDIYELTPGDFVIGEHFPAGAPDLGVASNVALDKESLPAIYRRYVGENVPPEVLQAEERRLAFVAEEQQRAHQTRAVAGEPLEQVIPAIYQQPAGSFQSKEVDHAVPWFVDCHCRGWGTWAQNNFNICLPERTGNGTVSKVDARGSYSAIYVFHGALDFSVRYRLTSWQTAFNVAVSEGFWYRARKVGPVRNYDVEARVANADGDGFNIALIGTTDHTWKHCYDAYSDLACAIVAGCPT